MLRRMQWIRASIGVGLFAFLCSCTPTPPDKPTFTQRADRPRLQSLALDACKCSLLKKQDHNQGCWAEYSGAIKPFQPNGDEGTSAAYACTPVSTEFDMLEDADGEFMVVTGYNVNGVPLASPNLCTRNEAVAVKEAFDAVTQKRDADGKFDLVEAKNAVEKALTAVREGKAPQVSASSSGCV